MKEDDRLSVSDLRSYDKYKNLSDIESEAVIDDLVALARLRLDLSDDGNLIENRNGSNILSHLW